jgi:site-specific DNA-methyltransferase (adenine-specific)
LSLSIKKVKGIEYLYFSYYEKGKKKEVYCGPADSPRALEKANALMRNNLQGQATSLQRKLIQYDNALTKPKTKKASKQNGKMEDALRALEMLRQGELYEPQVYYKSSEHMAEVPDGSVQLIVTSPPYNVGKEYNAYNDTVEFKEYKEFLYRVWTECKRKLCTGGRIAVNVAGTFRSPYIPMETVVTNQLNELGLLMRGVIYWNKGSSVGVSTAWGSWRQPNAILRDVGEFIVVFCKDEYKLSNGNRVSTITADQFTEYTKSMWDFQAADSRREGHPAPFPEELPKRLIQLYTYLGDTVLDPFVGTGTTCKVAKAWGRKSIGYEVDETYKPLIERKITSVKQLAIPVDAFAIKGRSIEDYGIAEEEIIQAVNARTKSSN